MRIRCVGTNDERYPLSPRIGKGGTSKDRRSSYKLADNDRRFCYILYHVLLKFVKLFFKTKLS